jgi:hypothetical protein
VLRGGSVLLRWEDCAATSFIACSLVGACWLIGTAPPANDSL